MILVHAILLVRLSPRYYPHHHHCLSDYHCVGVVVDVVDVALVPSKTRTRSTHQRRTEQSRSPSPTGDDHVCSGIHSMFYDLHNARTAHLLCA